MRNLRQSVAIFGIVATIFVAAGCSTNCPPTYLPPFPPPTGTGSAQAVFYWGYGGSSDTVRTITMPQNSNSVRVRLIGTAYNDAKTGNREESTSTLTFSGLQAGVYTAEVTAFSGFGAQGSAVATASTSIQVMQNQQTPINVTFSQ